MELFINWFFLLLAVMVLIHSEGPIHGNAGSAVSQQVPQCQKYIRTIWKCIVSLNSGCWKFDFGPVNSSLHIHSCDIWLYFFHQSPSLILFSALHLLLNSRSSHLYSRQQICSRRLLMTWIQFVNKTRKYILQSFLRITYVYYM